MTDDIEKWKEKLYPKLSINLSPDQVREQFAAAKRDLVAFSMEHTQKIIEKGILSGPITGRHHEATILDDVEHRPTATGTLALMHMAADRFDTAIQRARPLFATREIDLDEETLGFDPDDEELKVEVSIKKLNHGHVLIRAGCQERVVHSMEELYSMVRALLRVNVPETLFLKGGKNET